MIDPFIHLALVAPRAAGRVMAQLGEASRFMQAYGPKPGTKASMMGAGAGGRRPFELAGGAAVIGVHGVLLQSFPFIGYPFATGYDALRYQADAAFNDDQARAIVLDVNSGGGDVSGCFDLVDWLAESAQATGKPIYAICSEVAYSAAYAIASVADSIAVPRTGGVGSIGAMLVHWNYADAMGGAKPTLLQAGAHKTDGHPFGPLPEDVAAEWTAELESTRRLFAETVSRGRMAAGADLSVDAALATEARCYPAAAAVGLGLADAVVRPDQAFTAVVNGLSANQE